MASKQTSKNEEERPAGRERLAQAIGYLLATEWLRRHVPPTLPSTSASAGSLPTLSATTYRKKRKR